VILAADSRPHYFDALLRQAAAQPPLPTAVAYPCEDHALAAVAAAAHARLIAPILVGPLATIRALADAAAIDLAGCRLHEAGDAASAAAAAVALVEGGEAVLLMKGSLHTDTLLHAVLAPGSSLRTARRLSHVYVMDVPNYPRPLLVTDAAINIAPTLMEKRDIVQNAIELAHVLGIVQPRVALLSAVETVNPDIPSTIDAAALAKMGDRRQITGALLDGPLAFDNAVSSAAAAEKGIISAVAGQANILVVPT